MTGISQLVEDFLISRDAPVPFWESVACLRLQNVIGSSKESADTRDLLFGSDTSVSKKKKKKQELK